MRRGGLRPALGRLLSPADDQKVGESLVAVLSHAFDLRMAEQLERLSPRSKKLDEALYADVPPVKGVFRGAATAQLDASVRMQRTDAAGARRRRAPLRARDRTAG